MILILLCLVLLVSLLQPSAARFSGAMVASISTLCHHAFLSSADGLVYFGSAAALDSAALYVISTVRPVTQLAVRLQYVCLVSILCNALGWLMWMLYMPSTLYVTLYYLLYTWMVAVLLIGGPIEYLGGHKIRFRRPYLHSCVGARNLLDFKDGSRV